MIDQTMAWAQSVCVESCVVEFLVRYSILRLEFPMPTYEVGYMIFSQISFYDNQYPFLQSEQLLFCFALWLAHSLFLWIRELFPCFGRRLFASTPYLGIKMELELDMN